MSHHARLRRNSDANEAALERVLTGCRRWGNTRLGIQLAHAGRKASVHVRWQGGKPLTAAEGAWQRVAASPIPFDDDWPAPEALDAHGSAVSAAPSQLLRGAPTGWASTW
jgi:2,4-dienoyl-CoA reductase-like NADH-dependent reductase (Old Yellow Enzyme family)